MYIVVDITRHFAKRQKKFLFHVSLSVNFFKSVNIWQSYKQERGCLMHLRLANTLVKDEESTRDNHVLACNFAKYSPILKTFSPTDSAINLS